LELSIVAKERYRDFDPANYIETIDDAAHYLTAAAEGGDAAHFASALGDVARAQNMSALARKTGLTRVGLYKALSSDGNPSLDTAMRVLSSLGIRIAIVAEKPKRATKPRRTKAKAA
jgi:probable addiction module antidote protein